MTRKANPKYNLGHAEKHLTIHVPNRPQGWDLDNLKRTRNHCDKAGVTFEAIRMGAHDVTLGKGPERDRAYRWQYLEGIEAMVRVPRDVQFPFSICPDHMPRHADDRQGLQAFAFGYGYVKALMQAVNAEVPG